MAINRTNIGRQLVGDLGNFVGQDINSQFSRKPQKLAEGGVSVGDDLGGEGSVTAIDADTGEITYTYEAKIGENGYEMRPARSFKYNPEDGYGVPSTSGRRPLIKKGQVSAAGQGSPEYFRTAEAIEVEAAPAAAAPQKKEAKPEVAHEDDWRSPYEDVRFPSTSGEGTTRGLRGRNILSGIAGTLGGLLLPGGSAMSSKINEAHQDELESIFGTKESGFIDPGENTGFLPADAYRRDAAIKEGMRLSDLAQKGGLFGFGAPSSKEDFIDGDPSKGLKDRELGGPGQVLGGQRFTDYKGRGWTNYDGKWVNDEGLDDRGLIAGRWIGGWFDGTGYNEFDRSSKNHPEHEEYLAEQQGKARAARHEAEGTEEDDGSGTGDGTGGGSKKNVEKGLQQLVNRLGNIGHGAYGRGVNVDYGTGMPSGAGGDDSVQVGIQAAPTVDVPTRIMQNEADWLGVQDYWGDDSQPWAEIQEAEKIASELSDESLSGQMMMNRGGPIPFARGGGLSSMVQPDQHINPGDFVISADVVSGVGDGSSAFGVQRLAEEFGIPQSGPFQAALGGEVRGPGGGLDDFLQTSIAGKKAALLSNQEMVVPRDIVAKAALRNNPKLSPQQALKQGQDMFYNLMTNVRSQKNQAKGGNQPAKLKGSLASLTNPIKNRG